MSTTAPPKTERKADLRGNYGRDLLASTDAEAMWWRYDLPMLTLPDRDPPMSSAQRHFAWRQGATSGVLGLADRGHSVFLYREDERCCERWLVDTQGRVLEFATFPRELS